MDSGSFEDHGQNDSIRLSESDPLSNSPFVHVSIDQANRRPSFAQVPSNIQASRTPFPGTAPKAGAAVNRSFSQGANYAQPASSVDRFAPRNASTQGNARAAAMPSSRFATQVQNGGASISGKQVDARQARRPFPQVAANTPVSIGTADAGASNDPSLHVVLENKTTSNGKSGDAGAKAQAKPDPSELIQIGNDHVSVPSNFNEAEELQDMASSFPLIPKSLIFGDKAGASSGTGPNGFMDPRAFGSRGLGVQGSFGSNPFPYPQASSMPGSNPYGFVSGNPRTADADVRSAMPYALGSLNPQAAMPYSTASFDPAGAFAQDVPVANMPKPSDLYGRANAGMPSNTPSIAFAFPQSALSWSLQDPNFVRPLPLSPFSPPQSLAASGVYPASLGLSGAQNMDAAKKYNGAFARQGASMAPSHTGPSASASRAGSAPLASRMHSQAASPGVAAANPMGNASSAGSWNTRNPSIPLGASRNPASSNPLPSENRAGKASGPIVAKDAIGHIKTGSNAAKPNGQSKPTIFDEPPVPIADGMRDADTNHARRRVMAIAGVVLLVLAVLAGIGTLIWQGTINVNLDEVFVSQNSNSANPSAGTSGNSGAANGAQGEEQGEEGGAGSVVYQYSSATSDGTKYTVEETSNFNEQGQCTTTTMNMHFPDEAKAKAFTDNLSRDYGSALTVDSINGADVVVTIDNSALRLNREEYENLLRYSVEDLVIIKK